MDNAGLIQAEVRIREMVQEGDRIRATSPKDAVRIYLEASEECLRLSRKFPKEESRLVNDASAIYMRAKSSRSSFIVENGKEMISSLLLKPPERRFCDVAGMDDVKEDIRMKIIAPFKHKELFTFYNKKPGGGIIMYGPQGCGKSLLAEAAAGEAGIPFFNVKASDLKSKYVGETEKNIARLFLEAREHAPAIVFFDEIEALGQDRMDTNHIGRGFVSQLLTEMDGVGTKDAPILLLAATNTPWLVDPALLRHGRFGDRIFIPPPDLEARRGILAMHLRKKPLSGVDLSLIAGATDGFSGADLKAVSDDVTDLAIKEYFKTGKMRSIEYKDFAKALDGRASSAVPWFKRALTHIAKHRLEEHYADLFRYLKKGHEDGR